MCCRRRLAIKFQLLCPPSSERLDHMFTPEIWKRGTCCAGFFHLTGLELYSWHIWVRGEYMNMKINHPTRGLQDDAWSLYMFCSHETFIFYCKPIHIHLRLETPRSATTSVYCTCLLCYTRGENTRTDINFSRACRSITVPTMGFIRISKSDKWCIPRVHSQAIWQTAFSGMSVCGLWRSDLSVPSLCVVNYPERSLSRGCIALSDPGQWSYSGLSSRYRFMVCGGRGGVTTGQQNRVPDGHPWLLLVFLTSCVPPPGTTLPVCL